MQCTDMTKVVGASIGHSATALRLAVGRRMDIGSVLIQQRRTVINLLPSVASRPRLLYC